MASQFDNDQILHHLKPPGRWHVLQVVYAGVLLYFFTSMMFISTVFIGWSPPHHCTIPANATLNETVPGIYEEGVFIPAKCLMYDPVDNNKTIPCTDGWTFETGGWATIVTQWVLVCDQDFVSEFSQSLNALGLFVGSLVFTTTSDLFGRKKNMLVLNLIAAVAGVVTAYTTNVYWYSAMRIISGALHMGVNLSCFVYLTEIVPVAHRSFTVNLSWVFMTTGQASLGLLGYYIKDWRYFQLATTIPLFLTIAGFWLFHETIPWLLANNRGKEAARVFRRAAKINKVKVSPEVIEFLEAKTSEKQKLSLAETVKSWSLCCRKRTSDPDDVGIKEIFRNKKLRLFTVLTCLSWFLTTLIYYGITLSTASFAGDRFLNYCLSISVELPAYISCIFIFKRFGRRYPLMVFYGIAGVSLFTTGFVPKETASGTDLTGLKIALNTIGKYGISSAFGGVYLYTSELFPTNVRNRGVGLGSGAARIGGILAPFSAYLSRYHSWLVGVVFGILSLLTALLLIPLPETGHNSMPQTIEDVERLGKRKKNKNKNCDTADHEESIRFSDVNRPNLI